MDWAEQLSKDRALGKRAEAYGGGNRLMLVLGNSVNALLLAVFAHFYPPRMPTSILDWSLHLGVLVAVMVMLFFAIISKPDTSRHDLERWQNEGKTLRLWWRLPCIFVVTGLATALVVAVLCCLLRFVWASWLRMVVVLAGVALFFLYRRQQAAKAAAAQKILNERNAEELERRQKEAEMRNEAYRKAAARRQAEEAEQAKKRRELAKSEALGKFDAAAVNGAVERSNFRDALLPYVKELIAQAPLEAKWRNICQNEQLSKVVLPILDSSKEDVTHILDCDKLLELLFGLIDSNQNGSIERSEMEGMIDELCALVMDESQLQAALPGLAFKFVDRSKNGKLDLDEVNFLREVVLQLLGFAVTTSLSLAIRVAECPLFEDEAATFIGGLMSGDFARDEFDAKLEEFRKSMTPEMFGGMFMGLGPETVVKFVVSAVGVLKVLHRGTEASEGDLLTKSFFSGYEWLTGGIDKDTFVRFLAPMMKERVMTTPDLSKLKGAVEVAFKSVEGQAELVSKIEAALEKNWQVMEHSIVAAQGKAAEVVPDFCRLLFQLADIDGSGTISQREISILKEVFLCIITMAVVAAVHTADSAKQELPEAVTKELRDLCPEAFADVADGQKVAHLAGLFMDAATKAALAGFEVLDRNADSRVSKDEIGQLAVKLLSVVLHLMRCCWEAYFAAATAFSSDLLKLIWTQAGIGEVSMVELPAVLATLPSVMQAAVLP